MLSILDSNDRYSLACISLRAIMAYIESKHNISLKPTILEYLEEILHENPENVTRLSCIAWQYTISASADDLPKQLVQFMSEPAAVHNERTWCKGALESYWGLEREKWEEREEKLSDFICNLDNIRDRVISQLYKHPSLAKAKTAKVAQERTAYSHLIIGAGAFGAPTALYRAKSDLKARVAIVDPCRGQGATSDDINKIVSTAYKDKFYMDLAREAMDLWMNNIFYRPHFKKTGQVFMGEEEPARKVYDNYIELTGKPLTEIFDPEEAQTRFPMLKYADWTGIQKCTWSPEAGWIDSGSVLEEVNQAASNAGVEHIKGTVLELLIEDGICYGVKVKNKDKEHDIYADRVVLCTGAETVELLARNQLDIPARGLKAASVLMGYYKPTENSAIDFEKAPIIVKPVGESPGESIPPGKLGLVKCILEKSYIYSQQRMISTKDVKWEEGVRTIRGHIIAEEEKEKVDAIKREFYGSQEMEPIAYRICCDAITADQDFLICGHPGVKHLYIASGGSFHGYKYIPIIGKYVNSMIDGNLDPEMAQRWGWDGGKRSSDGACAIYAVKEP
ncbi:hypothetical protein FQN57_003265 [Myotisia sp. PD_48]|nr:hypothetical protein FQN57_003265 [Myotisia sp. PD_48]